MGKQVNFYIILYLPSKLLFAYYSMDNKESLLNSACKLYPVFSINFYIFPTASTKQPLA